jgi:ribonuclease BN (tRNA processing enzyme)
VAELHGGRLHRFVLQAGHAGARPLDEVAAADGVVHAEAEFRVRAATLDHGTPVLAFCLEPPLTVHVRKERLLASGLAPGPWLARLRQAAVAGESAGVIELPGGRRESVAALAAELLLVSAGERLAYATDFADTEDNRTRLARLAAGAHTLFCEASFLAADAKRAAQTGHLTAAACGAIGSAAGARFLVPFHFSRRYEDAPRRVYDEVRAACGQTVVPRGLPG